MTITVPDKFKGFAVNSGKEWDKPKLVEFDRKKILPTDVVLENICCGLCGTDVHTVRENWGPYGRKDLVVGHEIVGKVIAIGTEVTDFKIGDRVGVGACSTSCNSCRRCTTDNEQYCSKSVSTYNDVDTFSDGYVTQGGYASHSIANQQFCFLIPDKLDSVVAAPLMCAGLTVYSPLVRNINKLTNPVVGIIGIGGLGHLALQFANALGAKVYAFSRSSSKMKEAKQLGAHEFIATQENDSWSDDYEDTFDFILNCASSATGTVLEQYLKTLKVDGKYISVGLPPVGEKFEFHPFTFLGNASAFSSSLLGSKKEANEMLELCAEKGIKPLVEEVPINEKSCGEALKRCNDGDVRYRFVFTEFDKAFA